MPTPPVFIQLIPATGETCEGWFKLGGADAIADRLFADGKIKSCIITTSNLDFMQNTPQMPALQVKTLRADDYPTWSQRRRALFRLLISTNQQRPEGQRPEGQRPDGPRPDGPRPDGQQPQPFIP